MLPKFLTTVALAASLVSAQTFTDCDPTKRGKPPLLTPSLMASSSSG
jgi:hypothetical protein